MPRWRFGGAPSVDLALQTHGGRVLVMKEALVGRMVPFWTELSRRPSRGFPPCRMGALL